MWCQLRFISPVIVLLAWSLAEAKVVGIMWILTKDLKLAFGRASLDMALASYTFLSSLGQFVDTNLPVKFGRLRPNPIHVKQKGPVWSVRKLMFQEFSSSIARNITNKKIWMRTYNVAACRVLNSLTAFTAFNILG